MKAHVFALGYIVGLAIIASGVLPLKAFAQTSDYTTNWQATDLYVGRLVYPRYADNQPQCENWRLDPYGDPVNSEVVLGVAKWTVRGQLNGSTKYKELWATATPPSAFTFTGDFINNRCTNGRLAIRGNDSSSDWLNGWMNNSTLGASAMEIRTARATDSLTSISNIDSQRVGNIGKTTSCQFTNRCLFTAGSYSWTLWHEWEEAGNGKQMNGGTMIPLKWTITGYVCESGDVRCD